MITNNDVYTYRGILQNLYGIKNWDIESRLIIFASNVDDNRINGYSIDASRHTVSVSVRNITDAVSIVDEVGDIIRGYVLENDGFLKAILPANIDQQVFFNEFLINNNLVADFNIIGTKITISL